MPTPPSRRRGGPLVRIHAATAADPGLAAEFPTDAIFYDIRLEPYLLATARAHPDLAPQLEGAGRDDAGQQACPGAWRCQPEEHPVRAGRPGVPGCRVRVVGRSGVRSGVLPQPPAAEMPVDAARARRLPGVLRRDGATLTAPASTGSRRTRWKPAPRICCRDCSWRGWMASRRSSTSPPNADKDRVRRVRAALLLAPSDRLDAIRQAWTRELAT